MANVKKGAPDANRVTLAFDGVVGAEFGNNIATNTDPLSPCGVRYCSRCYPYPLGAVAAETCGFYLRMDHSADEHQVGLYGEVDTGQTFIGGSWTKVIHRGMGDAHYVALMRQVGALEPEDPTDMGGLGYEAATWSHRSVGFLASCQRAGLRRWKGFNALWDQDTLIDYAAFYAEGTPNRAFFCRKRTEATPGDWDGYAQFGIEEWDLSRVRWSVYNDGRTLWQSMPATAGATLKDSPELHLVGAYYSGAASHDREVVLKHVISAVTPASELRIYMGDVGATALKTILKDDGTLDLQNGPIATCGGVTMKGGGGSVDLQGGAVTNCANIQALTQLDMYVDAVAQASLSSTLADGDSALLLRCRDGAVYTLQRVTLGADDSGGAGYRCLRVPN